MFKNLAFLSLLGFNCAQANYDEYMNPAIRTAAVIASCAAGSLITNKIMNFCIRKLEEKNLNITAQLVSVYSYARFVIPITTVALIMGWKGGLRALKGHASLTDMSPLNYKDFVYYGIVPFLTGLGGTEAILYDITKDYLK